MQERRASFKVPVVDVYTVLPVESLNCPLLNLLQHLSDTYFGVRNKCLQLLGCLGTVDTPLTKDGEGSSTGMSEAGVQASARHLVFDT